MPVLCLAESAWSTGAQRLALVLGHEPDTSNLAERAFVPVFVDPLERPDDPAVRAHLLRTLDAMQAGGILDQLGGSFHGCARDERWVVPHFEKLVPLNAGLAAVYARAAAAFERPDYLRTATGAAAFASAGLELSHELAEDAGREIASRVLTPIIDVTIVNSNMVST